MPEQFCSFFRLKSLRSERDILSRIHFQLAESSLGVLVKHRTLQRSSAVSCRCMLGTTCSAARLPCQADACLHMQRLGRMVVEKVRSGQTCEIASGGHQVCYKLKCELFHLHEDKEREPLQTGSDSPMGSILLSIEKRHVLHNTDAACLITSAEPAWQNAKAIVG